MKRMRRCLTGVTAGISAAAMLCVSGVFTASASACGDLNGDGSYSLSDTVILTKYLSGMYELADYSIADTNDDGILSLIDRIILNDYIVGNISTLPYTG